MNKYFPMFNIIFIFLLISTTGCIEDDINFINGAGEVQYIDLEGGFYGIVADTGERYDPINLSLEFKEDGLRVRFKLATTKDYDNVHMWGLLVEILNIEIIKDNITSPDSSDRNFSIASWNLHIFGETKAGKPELLSYYADKLSEYDVFIIQEIRNKEGTAIQKLADQGFTLALDDYIYASKWDPILPLVDYIKVEVPLLTRKEIKDHVAQLKGTWSLSRSMSKVSVSPKGRKSWSPAVRISYSAS